MRVDIEILWTDGCVFEKPTMARAPFFVVAVGKLSLAPCAVLPLYSWPCWPVDGEQGKPWRHHFPSVLVKLLFLWTNGCVFSAAHHGKGTVASWCKSVLVSS